MALSLFRQPYDSKLWFFRVRRPVTRRLTRASRKTGKGPLIVASGLANRARTVEGEP